MLVIKIGGAAGVDYDALCRDIATHWKNGEQIVLVHGGSAATDTLAERLDHPPRFIITPSGHVSRYTDRETLDIFVMATAQLNRTLVERLQQLGVNAMGLSGLDGRLMQARRKEAIRNVEDGRIRLIRDDWTGTVTSVNTKMLHMLVNFFYLPVVAPLALSEQGQMLNVDGDRAAAAIAGALQADTLVLLSNVVGLMRNFPDETSLVTKLRVDELKQAEEWAQGRMKKKIMGVSEAAEQGVKTMIIGDGRRATPLTDALNGSGTTINT